MPPDSELFLPKRAENQLSDFYLIINCFAFDASAERHTTQHNILRINILRKIKDYDNASFSRLTLLVWPSK